MAAFLMPGTAAVEILCNVATGEKLHSLPPSGTFHQDPGRGILVLVV